jgi:hypothetical protein
MFMRTIEFQHFSAFAPSLARTSTPDWMLYLVAKLGGFDAVVTRDLAQFTQREELVAIALTELTVVTWRQPVEDPLAEWGQLMAYAPQIAKRVRSADYSPTVIFLPAPRLNLDQTERPLELARALAGRENMPYNEWQSAALAVMREALDRQRGTRALQLKSLLADLAK